ncbi:Uma2 family endonuclease [Actinomadura miaoliensis]|uniref:Uma2 family endonuclease n=1 Tax=Actinomadura miaoliensis TaxID=430685 RepID=A0ABP7WLY1_9ACTN
MISFAEQNLSLPPNGITAADYDRMPVEVCRRIEVVDGRPIVSPSDTPRHNGIAHGLGMALERSLPPPWDVTGGVDLRLSEVPLTNRRPDVMVYRGDRRKIPVLPADVLLIVEVMGMVSMTTDKFDKPAEYAHAKIPHFWRVEQHEDDLILFTYRLDRPTRRYLLTGVHPGAIRIAEPFPAEIDLAALATTG